MESVLRYWEGLDDVSWDDDARLECSTLIESQHLTVDQWKALLVEARKLPADVVARYRKVFTMLLGKEMIDQFAFDAEMKAMDTFSPATLARRGKEFADWYREIPIDTCVDFR